MIIAAVDFGMESIGGTSAIIEEFLSSADVGALSAVLIGATERGRKIGAWGDLEVAGKPLRFMPVSGHIKSGVVPARIALFHGLLRARKAVAGIPVDVVYAHCPEAVIAMRALLPKIPVVLHVHGTASPLAFSRFRAARHPLVQALYQKSVMRLALTLSTHVFVTSDKEAYTTFCTEWGTATKAKSSRVPAMVDTKRFTPTNDRIGVRRALGLEGSESVVISVGRIERTKGCGDAFEAFRQMRAGGARAKYIIVGDGSYKESLMRMVREAALDEEVTFTGALPRAEVARLLSAADVFLSGSWQEGFSVALLEAMACGLPAVATDVGGVRELLDDGVNGYVVNAGNIEGLANALAAAVSESDVLRVTCRERALKYDTRTITSRLVEAVLACCTTEALVNKRAS